MITSNVPIFGGGGGGGGGQNNGSACCMFKDTVDSGYLDFGYLEYPLISKRKSGPSLNLEI